MPSVVSRRSLLGGAAGLAGAAGGGVALSGCSVDVAGSSGTRAARTPDQLTSDERAVLDLVRRLAGSVDLLARTGRRYPLLAAPLAATLAAERTHLETLRRSARAGDLPTVPTPTIRPATSREAALSAARRDTTALRTAYFSAARRADSGSFARLLASMGCSLSQRLPGIAL